jgi:hypothetical protein
VRSVAEQCKAYVEMIEQHMFTQYTSNIGDTRFVSTILINVDAALFTSLQQMGVGVVI